MAQALNDVAGEIGTAGPWVRFNRDALPVPRRG